MKESLYMKVILTIIAIFLGLNLLKDFQIIQPAQAAVRGETIDVNIKSVGNQYIYNGAIPVTTNR